ncbi:AAA family ATPase, partial [Bellilinea sp.]|uniref:AAA family ATPase n=1 Tax=Bellilinea sp. TaxID=2838785 RepID=UPI002ADD39B1
MQRSALLDRLQAGIHGKVTIVSAPPGFGKSTLLAEWMKTAPAEQVAWYSLDEDDDDTARFFGYIAAALRTVQPDCVPSLETLLETLSPNPRELAAALINDLSQTRSKEIVLVLDDYHHITQQSIHDAVAYLID